MKGSYNKYIRRMNKALYMKQYAEHAILYFTRYDDVPTIKFNALGNTYTISRYNVDIARQSLKEFKSGLRFHQYKDGYRPIKLT